MEISDVLSIIIPSFVTMFGFIISFKKSKKEYLQSIQKYKSEQQLSDLYGLQKDVLLFCDMIQYQHAFPEATQDGFGSLRDKIRTTLMASGSEDAVKLSDYAFNLIYSGIDDNVQVSIAHLLAVYVMMAMQIKYDTTGVKTSPNSWYVGRYTTQKMIEEDFYNDSIKWTNKIADELELESFLKICNG